MKLAVLLLSLLMSFVASAQGASPWKVTKTSWSQTDEKNYSDFVAAIGKAKCGSFDSCIKNPANPYRSTDSGEETFYSDCADLPYMLRSYFASKNGLPFTLITAVSSADGVGGDIRYSPNGNLPRDRMDVVVKPGPTYPNKSATFSGISNTISSAMFRFDPQLKPRSDVIEIDGKKYARLVPDFYSVRVDREGIEPGSVIYDPNGHVAVVYSVEADGRVLFMDSHPDNSLTRGTYGKKFSRSRPGMGAGFKKFRPIQLVGASKDDSGNLIGGKVYLQTDGSIEDYDITQFYGNKRGASWSKGQFEEEGQVMDYYEWVRVKLASANLRFHPVEELRNMMDALCGDIKDRITAVDTSLAAGIQNKEQPYQLPKNIYGTDGEWESFSTPSRDARLKTSFVEMFDNTKSMVERFRKGDPRIDYSGADLIGDLLAAYNEETAQCVVSYKKTNGATQDLNFDQVRERLYALSFDPYHCAELRWGATGEELNSCDSGSTKMAWYKAEQRLRNQIDRVYDARMDFTLEQLKAKAPGSGVDQGPDVDVKAWLNSAR